MTEEVSQSLRALTIDADNNSDVSGGSDVLAHDSSDETSTSTETSAVGSDEPYVVVLIDAHTHHVSFTSVARRLGADIWWFKSELTSAENEGSRVAELLEQVVHHAIGPRSFEENAARIVVRVYVDLASLFMQQVRSRSLRRVPGGSRDLFEAFFVEFTERFSHWTLNDMRTEYGVEIKIMGMLTRRQRNMRSTECNHNTDVWHQQKRSRLVQKMHSAPRSSSPDGSAHRTSPGCQTSLTRSH
jgi:hypothetical protein